MRSQSIAEEDPSHHWHPGQGRHSSYDTSNNDLKLFIPNGRLDSDLNPNDSHRPDHHQISIKVPQPPRQRSPASDKLARKGDSTQPSSSLLSPSSDASDSLKGTQSKSDDKNRKTRKTVAKTRNRESYAENDSVADDEKSDLSEVLSDPGKKGQSFKQKERVTEEAVPDKQKLKASQAELPQTKSTVSQVEPTDIQKDLDSKLKEAVKKSGKLKEDVETPISKSNKLKDVKKPIPKSRKLNDDEEKSISKSDKLKEVVKKSISKSDELRENVKPNKPSSTKNGIKIEIEKRSGFPDSLASDELADATSAGDNGAKSGVSSAVNSRRSSILSDNLVRNAL